MKKLWIIVAIIIIAIGAWWMKGGSVPGVPLYDATATPSSAAQASKSPVAIAKKTATPAPTQTSTYTQLVTQFGSNRIQFDANCRATPSTVSFKNGTQILLDNRANQSRTISVGGTNYYLGAYGYQVITLSSSTLPKKLDVSCNNQINAATINLQATISGE